MILHLLQLASPTLPVGAYSYSEGLETLVDRGIICDRESLSQWLEASLRHGAIRLEAAMMLRSYLSVRNNDLTALGYWNSWASAAKETAELRSQSWQMGNSLIKLLLDLDRCRPTHDKISLPDLASAAGVPCNYAIAFGIAAADWQIDITAACLGYLHSWASNLIGAGVKLIPLGQTLGQQLLLEAYPQLSLVTQEVLALEDSDLNSCSWGLAISSMIHETQYTRLFRS
ncbi:MAG TPA: urease accessory protein UreF [Cyanobacteria bacterium UBA11149]|nr:urease accessory protein UreF [Cyanobacteria bacterium UBA11367]HBE60726.1 urease accessory protein UreF [Cyanobacteria bacterium UBA11366]HBK65457.1 urease accessory protein UreF [Cyanobacteria bacterium UBA11166]HBR74477.1 urease accessory protein UreF [Cyanobacteria bacterium UBA11159]HBS68275.1 urease accessory protein UreF [Cyanobacteria bacterium UBA11153]HBW91384.1 urease accessory protein UreF [Cyanobacteria bacterium UBA11149]HCA93581.1 urease accessory protein UreF [Cyanobacteria